MEESKETVETRNKRNNNKNLDSSVFVFGDDESRRNSVKIFGG
jgi:hypothetical protein